MNWTTWQHNPPNIRHICVPDSATYAIRQAFLDCCKIRRQSYWAVVDRVASPAHDVQNVVSSVHLAVNAVQDCVVCMQHIKKTEDLNSYYNFILNE